MREPLYLEQNIQVEPLVDQWYAWSHLISPATAARNLTERHFKIMDSYISSPQIHANAAKNPKLAGGPYIDYEGKRKEEIRELRERTKRERSDLITLSSALAELDNYLTVNAKGFCLQQSYSAVPDILRGYVELVYDLNNYPSYRILEPLLYRSKYYDRMAQSMMLSITSGDDRPFIMSTPRLESDDIFHLKVPFDDRRVDRLFKLKTEPLSWPEVKELVGSTNGKDALLMSFLTPNPPRPYSPYTGRGARWRYFGHACVLLEMSGVSLMFDPCLSYAYQSDVSRYTYQDLPDFIDYVLITHNHQDHMLFETLLQIRHKVKTIIVPRGGSGHLQDPSLKLILENSGFRNVIELGEMESIDTGKGSVTGLPFLGEHSDLDIRTKLAYLVRFDQHSILFAADSCNIEPRLYEHLHDVTGDVEVLFLGMECDGAPLSWAYGPLLSQRMERGMDESRRLAGSNFEQAIDIVNRFNCKEVYVYAMGQEPWLNYVMSLKYTDTSRPIIESNKLIEECKRRGLIAERLFGEKEILVD
jgi:L-ascorbate metabolism protein UlaG (beta-lactamase superfamily)